MIDFARRIRQTAVEPGSLAVFWLAQAGFVFKTPQGTVLYVDPYLTDCVERLAGFKRIMASLVAPDEVDADAFVSTHSHPDHLDVDALPVLARKAGMRFVGAADCRQAYRDAGIADDRVTVLAAGQSVRIGDATLTGVYADHGELAPDALGLLIQAGGVTVWQVGDTAYRPDKWQDLFARTIDVILPPINGAYGNLDGVEAARLAHDAHASVAIPCHYWMFAEHNGNPAQFLQAMKEHAPEVQAHLMTQGELFVYRAKR